MKLILSILFSFGFLFSEASFEEIQEAYVKSYNYEQIGNYNEALKVLSPLYMKYPKNYTMNLRFAWLFYLSKKYTDACKYYQVASLLNTSALAPRLGLIRIYLDTQDYKKAEIFAYKHLQGDYYNYYGNLYMIKALIAQDKYEIAKTIIHKMLALYPTDIVFLEELAIVYKKTHSSYLKKLYEDILILDPNNILVKQNM